MLADFFITAALVGFLAFFFLIGYVTVEIIGMCFEAVAYLVEKRKRRNRKEGV